MIDPIAYAADGSELLCGDGPELLAYRSDGAPAWKVFTEGILVGAGIVVDQAVTVDDQGRVCWRRRGNGELLHEIQLGGRPTDAVIAPDGAVAALVDGGVFVIPHGQAPRFIPILGVSSVAWGPDGNSLGVGAHSGAFAAYDPHTGQPWGSVQLGASVVGVGWSQLGQWVVGAGEQLALVSGDGSEVLRALATGQPLERVAVSQDGLLGATIHGMTVGVFALQDLQACGELVFRRALAEVRFGAGHWLAVGLDDGDATMVELLTGSPTRTEPHPGRGRNVWAMDNKVDRELLRGAVARHRAGGGPIARWVGPKEDEPKEETGCLRSALTVGCFTLLGFLVCSGGIGLLWWMQQQGYF